MRVLLDYFNGLSLKVKLAKEDIDILVKKIESKDKEDVGINKRIVSSSKIEPITRLRKNVEEVKKEQECPEVQFIKDRIEDIFK